MSSVSLHLSHYISDRERLRKLEGQSTTVMNSSGLKNQQASPHVQQEHKDLLTGTAAEPHKSDVFERINWRFQIQRAAPQRAL